jgi:hypothetical protein
MNLVKEIKVNGNGNGLFLKIVLGALTAGLAGAGGGMIKLYRDVGVLQTSSGIEKRVDTLEVLARDIGTDRDKRTIIIQGFRDDILDIKRRVENLEKRR